MRKSFIFTEKESNQILSGISYDYDMNGISFSADAIEGIDTNYLAISNSIAVEAKIRPDTFYMNDSLANKLMTCRWKDEAIDVTDYGAILSGNYVYLVPVILNLDFTSGDREVSVIIGDAQIKPIKRNQDNFLHPVGTILSDIIHEITSERVHEGLYGFYYDSSNFVSSAELKLVYLNVSEVKNPLVNEVIVHSLITSGHELKNKLLNSGLGGSLDKKVSECIVKALKKL